ncbi:MAG: S4 domain-containing protein [Pseudomonadota bacterium]
MRKAQAKKQSGGQGKSNETACRLDKWLWAARFFKTRQQAKNAIERGKIKYDGARPKSSRTVQVGVELVIQKEREERTVIVDGLGVRRGSATDASLLYTETEESIEARLAAQALKKAEWAAQPDYGRRPDKASRRKIHRFKNVNDTD